jgi:hypothetical protein
MNAIETAPGNPLKMHFFERLKFAFYSVFLQKKYAEELAKKMSQVGEEAQKKRVEYESETHREEEERRFQAIDAAKPYQRQRSGEIEEVRADLAKSERVRKVKENIEMVIIDPKTIPEGAKYLVDKLKSDPDLQMALEALMEERPQAAEAVNALISRGRELHGDPRELIKVAQQLAFEADQKGNLPEIMGVLDTISQRAKALLREEYEIRRKEFRSKGGHGPANYLEILEGSEGIILDQARDKLKLDDDNGNFDVWDQGVDDLIKKPYKAQRADWVKAAEIPADRIIAKNISGPIDQIWGELERLEMGGGLSVEDMKRFYKELLSKRDAALPKDVLPGTEGYDKAAQSLDSYTQEKLDALSRKLAERLATERPSVARGITDVNRFLEAMTDYKGHFGSLLEQNPEMKKLFYSLDSEKGRKFRDKVFLRIHSAILSDRRNSSSENFGLYERADFTSFIDLIRSGLAEYTVRDTGLSLGQTLSDYYNNLSNGIRQSRDIDYWATQPAANFESFTKSLGMFQNEYIKHAMMFPAVNAAFRAYETTLRSIMNSNDGYLPPSFFEYNVETGGRGWDQMSQKMLQQMIAMGSVRDLDRDPLTGLHILDKDGHSVKMNFERPLELNPVEDQDEILMYMTLAKGVGLASARFLEYFANSRVPGSDHPEKGMEGFHSMPYETVARAMNYMSQVICKWKFGSYKYFYLFNMALPHDKQIHFTGEAGEPHAAREAIKLYQAYQDGTFEEKYGKEAKRMLDFTNLSGISSAIGKDTLWRQYDSTILWSDKMRELLGGPTQLALAGRYAGEAVKRHFVEGKYRELYRAEIERINREQGKNLPVSGGGFDKLWKEYGRSKYAWQIQQEWEQLEARDLQKTSQLHTPLRHEQVHAKEAFEKAFKARVWTEMAMRNPLVVAHSLKVFIPNVGVEGTKKVTLHTLLVQKILGVTPEDMKYGDIYGEAKFGASPTPRQIKYMSAVMQLEGDLAAVKELAINDEKGYARDLTEDDFKIIKDDTRRNQALEYWRTVRRLILGSDDMHAADHLYDHLGMKLTDNGQDYEWDFGKIHHQDHVFDELKSHGGKVEFESLDGQKVTIGNLMEQAVNLSPEWILGTDDMAFNRMDILNLGSRHWVRRGGDIAAHDAGWQKVSEFLTDGLVPNPDKHELAKMFKEIRNAYSGDMIEAGWTVVGNLAYLTDKLYSWDWRLMGSAAQHYVWRTRRGVAAWLANGRREFWDGLEHADVLPPGGHFYYYNHINDMKVDIHHLRKLRHADNFDVWKEIIIGAALAAIAITIWKGLTSSEEEGGGGGHH